MAVQGAQANVRLQGVQQRNNFTEKRVHARAQRAQAAVHVTQGLGDEAPMAGCVVRVCQQ